MKKFIVSWWDGQALVEARTAEDAKAMVRGTHPAYVRYGRRAPLFAEEVSNG